MPRQTFHRLHTIVHRAGLVLAFLSPIERWCMGSDVVIQDIVLRRDGLEPTLRIELNRKAGWPGRIMQAIRERDVRDRDYRCRQLAGGSLGVAWCSLTWPRPGFVEGRWPWKPVGVRQVSS